MPWTPWRRMSSAILNASESGVFFSTTCSSRSFSITISVSTLSRELGDARLGLLRAAASLEANGRVTTPTVSASSSRAISATIGAPPVPVPPPSPAVTKIMSAPFSASFSSSRLSIAASWPTAGSAPAPRPRVAFAPMWIFTSASHIRSACASVFTATNSTPGEAGVDHAVDGVRAAAADADDLDHGEVVPGTISHLNVARPQALVQAGAVERLLPRQSTGRFPALSTRSIGSRPAKSQPQPAT